MTTSSVPSDQIKLVQLDPKSPCDGSAWERQIALEQDMQRLGIERIRKQMVDAKERGEESSTRYGRDLLSDGLEPVSRGVQDYLDHASTGKANRAMQYAKHLYGLEPETVAYFALSSIINYLFSDIALVGMAKKIGTLIEDEIRHRYYEEKEPGLWVVTKRRIKNWSHGSYKHARVAAKVRMSKLGVNFDSVLDDRAKLRIGMRLIEIVIEKTGIVNVETVQVGWNDKKTYLRPTPETVEWVKKKIDSTELLSTEYLPCVIKPKPWIKPVGGGYHTEFVRRLRVVKSRNKQYLDELFAKTESGQLAKVYKALNAMQETPWKINTKVYEVMKNLWDSFSDAPIMPSRNDLPLPTKPIDIETNEESRRAWRKAAALIYQDNIILGSHRYRTARLLSLAGRFKDEASIYFPHQLDFRGRAYPVPTYLNPQGSDDSKALLTFSNGIPITNGEASDWLCIHGANVYGYDKVSLQDRVQWVQDNLEMIVSCGLQPLEDTRWMKADKPWQFLAFCFEYNGFLEVGFGYVSHLPVAVDGSCNGLQHFSAMLKDPIGGAAVNLVPSDTPKDIYQEVANVVIRKLQGMPDNSLAVRWLEFGITRKTTKRPVMVLPYGGTRYSCVKFIEDYIDEALTAGRPKLFQDDRKEAAVFLAAIVWDSIGEVVVAAKEAMGWLQDVAKMVSKEDLPINWTTPSGFIVQQQYLKTKGDRVDINLNVGRVVLTLESETDKLDPSRQRNGISPNFVHSMDASALVLCINASLEAGISDFAMVHDSYATHAANMQTLGVCLRKSFVQLYESDVLANFKQEVSRVLLTGQLPSIPNRGSLDVSQVMESDFFFA